MSVDCPSYRLTIKQGATLVRTFTLTLAGAPVDLTGYTARMQIRQHKSSPTAYASWSSAGGHFAIDEPGGVVTLTVSATATAALSFTKGEYDVELVSPAGVVDRIAEGPAILSKEVTR